MENQLTQMPLFGEPKSPRSDGPVKRMVIRVLNLYAGLGGNRKKWENVEVTAVEYKQDIADIYKDNFPNDTVIVGDAHEYLLHHYKEFDFIWSSPPCPTHSKIRECGAKRGQYPPMYPDFKLWQEITFLKHFARCKWVVENVDPYYEPIIQPTFKLDRHCFWSNFFVPSESFKKKETAILHTNGTVPVFGFDISEYKLSTRKDQVLRNLVNPCVGAHILEYARR